MGIENLGGYYVAKALRWLGQETVNQAVSFIPPPPPTESSVPVLHQKQVMSALEDNAI